MYIWSEFEDIDFYFCSPLGAVCMPTTNSGFQTTINTFQMSYCMIFYSKGHQNCQKSKLKVPKSSLLFSKWDKVVVYHGRWHDKCKLVWPDTLFLQQRVLLRSILTSLLCAQPSSALQDLYTCVIFC